MCIFGGIIHRPSELQLRPKKYNVGLTIFSGLHIGGDICKVVHDENSILEMHSFSQRSPKRFFSWVKANFRLDYINPTGCVFR